MWYILFINSSLRTLFNKSTLFVHYHFCTISRIYYKTVQKKWINNEDGQNCSEYVVSNNESSCPKELYKEKQLTEMRPPAASVERVKKRVASDENSNSEISVTIQQLDKTAQNAAEEKPYDQFGKFFAAEFVSCHSDKQFYYSRKFRILSFVLS